MIVQKDSQSLFGGLLAVADATVLLLGQYRSESHTSSSILDFALDLDRVLTVDDARGVVQPQGILPVNGFVACPSLSGRAAICMSSHNSLEGMFLWDGVSYVFDLPLVGWQDESGARASYTGNPGDMASFPYGDADLDGDGLTDLAVGAYPADGVGRLAVLSDPPDGAQRLWDVADATFAGTVYGGGFGMFVSAGDLDGDGTQDLLVGAPISTSDGGAFSVFRGPIVAGVERTAADADWTVHGSEPTDWTAYGAAVGDLDGDGAPDLVVGQPRNFYATLEPGRALLLQGPVTPGTYADSDADVIVTNQVPPTDNDAFGRRLAIGDVDGDGADDVVIGALKDVNDAGQEVGSVQLLFGGADLFP